MAEAFPRIDGVGLGGMLVRFGAHLDEAANRAALAFRREVELHNWPGVEECSTSLVSTFLRFDPLTFSPDDLRQHVETLLEARDWYAEPFPEGVKEIDIPTCYDASVAPQLAETADLAGVSVTEAIAELSEVRVRVTAIGFAPGQPYLGQLPPRWDVPRQPALTPQVPKGALVLAIRQFVLFTVSAPTGWRHVGQTTATLFRPDAAQPFLLQPGDAVRFPAVSLDRFEALCQAPDGGVTSQLAT